MKIVFSENTPLYTQYLFPYSIYGISEETDSLQQIYAKGFIPTRIQKDLYYMARSTRINLTNFKESSELRRIDRKTEGLTVTATKLKDFNYDYTLGKQMKDFYDTKFGKKTLSAQKAKWLFTSDSFSHVLEYKIDNSNSKDNVIGYCIINLDQNIMHYAYPFYSLESNQPNLGMGMMLKAVQWGREQKLNFVYLGTSYTEASLYKTQFPGFQWCTGNSWNSSVKELKNIIRNTPPTNAFIESENREEILKSLTTTINL